MGERAGWLLALGFPGAIWNVSAGQNGFLTTALIGGALGLLERHPALAGCCLGLLTYKPQFGVLFPLVLVATGRWRAFVAAAAVAVALAALSWLAFGSEPWLAMAQTVAQGQPAGADRRRRRLEQAAEHIRAGARARRRREPGVDDPGRRRDRDRGRTGLLVAQPAPFDLKAAALAAGAVLVTPYVFAYDLVVLAVLVAFLLRFGLARGFLRFEGLALAAAGVLLLSYIVATTQVGLAASLIVALLIARRLFDDARQPPVSPATG